MKERTAKNREERLKIKRRDRDEETVSKRRQLIVHDRDRTVT